MNLKLKRHSLAHIMAQAVKQNFPEAKIATGPDTEDGFYYDFDFGEIEFSDKDLKKVEKTMKKMVSQWQNFKKFDVDFSDARKILDKMWEWFKNELVDKIESWDFKNTEKLSDKITFYLNISKWKNSEYYSKIQEFLKENNFEAFDELDWDQVKNLKFIDMCTGPHVDSTTELDANSFKLARVAGAYWLGDAENKQLTRIYAYAFENKEELDKHLKMLEEAKRRDHRILGQKLELFTFSDLVGSGLPMFTPEWTFMRNAIEDCIMWIQSKYWFEKVSIPHITKKDLYEVSGHWAKYKDDLFHVRWKSDTEFVMKPMNCPHHAQIYASKARSYRDLPVRYVETTTCYRDELQWELLWISRVRSLTQDDWHIFCRVDQIWEEVKSLVKVIKEFYTPLWMFEEWKFWVSLSVRDMDNLEKYLWKEENWDKAEKFLENVAKEEDLPYKRVEWEAAFYWPKLDFQFRDAIGREWQLATVQIDFVQPANFELEYTNDKWEKDTPVMIHRAIAWSLERFMSVIIEHFAWVFPLWLSPRQVKIIPVMPNFDEYAKKVETELKEAWIRVTWDYSTDWLNKKVRMAEKMHNNYILVIWEKEETDWTVSVRNYKTKEQTVENLEDFKSRIIEEIKEKKL